MRRGNQLNERVELKRGVRQGCVQSQDLYDLYREHTFRPLKEMKGLKVSGVSIKNIRFADGSV